MNGIWANLRLPSRNPHSRPGRFAAYNRRFQPARFVVLFALLFLVGFALLFMPFVRPIVQSYSRGLVTISAALIHVGGGGAIGEGSVLRSQANGFAIEMKDGCNAVNVIILLWAAIFAFPASWPEKAKGVLLGSAAVQVVNLGRFISLFYLGQHNLAWFEFAHGYLWESLIMLDALVIFALWVRMSSGSTAIVHAGR